MNILCFESNLQIIQLICEKLGLTGFYPKPFTSPTLLSTDDFEITILIIPSLKEHKNRILNLINYTEWDCVIVNSVLNGENIGDQLLEILSDIEAPILDTSVYKFDQTFWTQSIFDGNNVHCMTMAQLSEVIGDIKEYHTANMLKARILNEFFKNS